MKNPLQFISFPALMNKFCLVLASLLVWLIAISPISRAAAQSSQALSAAAMKGGADAASAASLARTVSATIRQQAKLTPPPGAATFGFSVSLSGNRGLVGAITGSDGSTGSAYVFVFDGTTWSLESELKASDGRANDSFGASVSLSGNRALVGADSSGASGAAYVFFFDGTTWIQETKLTPNDGQNHEDFGSSVSLLGGRALIGAFNDNSGTGSAYVFTFDNVTWTQTAKLTPPAGAEGGSFGDSVSLSGKRALIGASLTDGGTGSAYIFVFDGTTWSLEAELKASDGLALDFFASSVSLSGHRALIGAPFDDNGAFGNGSAYIFAFDGTTWTQEAKLSASAGANNDEFGWSVALLGQHALVGAVGVTRDRGSAYLFAFDGTTWSQQDNLFAFDSRDGDQFGWSVSLSGTRALIGARDAYVHGVPTGAAYVFGR